MRRPPVSIAIVAAIFLALAVLDLYRGLAPLFQAGRLAGDDVMVLGIAVAAAVAGGFVLYGHNWARWLMAAWAALHVAISIGNVRELVGHVVIFGVLLFLVFRPAVREFFRRPASP